MPSVQIWEPPRTHDVESNEVSVKIRDVLKRLNAEGWYVDRQKGSHRQLKHPDKPGRVTVAGHPSMDLHPDTLKSISQQAGWEQKS